jgi:hypothetical protein
MKKAMGKLILLGVFLFTIGCTYHINPHKFDIDPGLVKPFSGNSPVNIIGTVLKNGERKICYHGMRTSSRTFLVDFNQVTNQSVKGKLNLRQIMLNGSAGQGVPLLRCILNLKSRQPAAIRKNI